MKEIIPLTGDVRVPAQLAHDFVQLLVLYEQYEVDMDSGGESNVTALVAQAKRCRQNLELFGFDVDPGFGVDAGDSARLLGLRIAIDTHLGWSSLESEKQGDYVARLQEVGEALAALGARERETEDAVEAMTVERLEEVIAMMPPKKEAQPDPSAELRVLKELLAMYGFDGGRATQELSALLGRLRLLEIERPGLSAQAADNLELRERVKRQRAELRRLHRDARARALARLEGRVLTQYADKDAARRRLMELCANLQPVDLEHLANVLSQLGYV